VDPDLDLHAYDSEGRHVGMDYSNNSFDLEIPEVDRTNVSGDQPGIEWIQVPDNTSVEFEVDSRGVEEWIDWLKDNRNTSEDKLNEALTDYTFRLDRYGDNATVNITTGEIEDGLTVPANRSIAPGETSIGSIPAEVDFEPETLNKRSEGRWVTANVTTPNENVSVDEVNLSTVRLNGEVGAVDDEQFGFVRNRVKDRTLKVRFPRDEVSELLETGGEVRVTITGTTEDDVIIAGSDEIRVIEPGQGQCSSGSQEGGPSGGTPGNGYSGGGNSGGGPP